ncbi:trace amine-associated receptor 1-like [Kryptolebias marmoratus]|uniref:trace amine-associated receptor 1-like n=1 Tax=Kryptolebias marmoratus TaxID=37003 RepID=UPI0007F8B619|nr:trace amine-associated receptor 1-like [Kryptolebias marmoratus]
MEQNNFVNRTNDVIEDQLFCNESTGIQEQTVTSYFLYAVAVSLSLLIICGNFLVIISIAYFKQLHTPTNYLLLSLAVADLLVGALVLPFSTILSLSSCWYLSYLLCVLRDLFDLLLCASSILHLCFISVDRYYAVCKPLTYATKMTVRVSVTMILLSWTPAALIGIGITIRGMKNYNSSWKCDIFKTTKESSIGAVFAFYIPAFMILTIYLKILMVAKKQARSIQNTTKLRSAVSKREGKASKTLALVMGVFLICWTPYFFLKFFFHMKNHTIPVLVIEAFKWLGWSNSMLNPFVYAFFYNWFRSAFKMIISGKIFQGDFTDLKLF